MSRSAAADASAPPMSNSEHSPTPRRAAWTLRVLLRGGMVIGLLVASLQAAMLQPILPEAVATHFDLDGTAVGWMSAVTFLSMHLVTVVTVMTACITLPILLRARDRRRARRLGASADLGRLALFEERILVFGLATITFTIAITHVVAAINLAPPPAADRSLPIVVGTYLVFAAVWAVRTLRHIAGSRPRPVAA